jgi:hypothetical protein
LVLKTSKEIIAAMTAYSRAANNPAFDGWIFEFDFLNSVKNAVTTEKAFVLNNHVSSQTTNAAQKTHEQGKTSWDITSTKTFANVKDICAWDPTSFKDKSLFLIPEKWNQSGFDGVFVSRPNTRGQRTVSFVQIFRSRKHSLKLSYYEEMRKVIADVIPEEFTCEVIFAIPTGHDCTGLTNCSGGLENWDKAIKVVQFERTA